MKILFLLGAKGHSPDDRNMNHFQRVYFLSREAELTILGVKGADFSVSAAPGTEVIHAHGTGRGALILKALVMALTGKARKYDIILSEPSIVCVGAFFLTIFSSAKWVVDVWDIPIRGMVDAGLPRRMYRKCMRFVLRQLFRKADLFILSILPDYEWRKFDVTPTKSVRFKNAIWFSNKKTKKQNSDSTKVRKTFKILCMRSLHTFDMGLDTLCYSFLKLRKFIDELELVIIGDIEESVRLELKRVLGVQGIRLTGFINNEQLNHEILNSDVVVIPFKNVPDLAQTYPIKVLEYLEMEKLIIASNIKGISQLLKDRNNALLFEAGNVNDLFTKIYELYSDKNLQSKILHNIGQLDPEFNCVNKNSKIIESLINLMKR